MDLILGLLGVGTLSILVQAKAIPSEEDALKAAEKLEKDPEDKAANLVVGKYRAFALGDFKGAMPFLAKSSDSTLKTLAEHEVDPAYADAPDKQVKMGNEWVVASKKFPALLPIFFDRASYWYMTAWPNLELLDQAKLRVQAKLLAQPRRPGPAKKALPTAWQPDPGLAVVQRPELDNTIARSGSYSAKTFPANETVPNGFTGIKSVPYPVRGQTFEAAASFRTDGTENRADRFLVDFYDNRGSLLAAPAMALMVDMPFWNRIVVKGNIPPGAATAQLVTRVYSKKGNVWMDDAVLRFNEIDDLKNGSFEEK